MRQTHRLPDRNSEQPQSTPTVHQVGAWRAHGVLLERYRFAPHLTVSLPPHSHEEYQFGLSLTDAGEYHYRGAYHPVPVGSLSVIHPGERHEVCGLGIRPAPSVFLSFYFPVPLVKRVWSEANDRTVSTEPHVPRPIILDGMLERKFRNLHRLLADPARLPLAQEEAMASALFALFRDHGEDAPFRKELFASNEAVRRAREFLDCHYAEIVSYEVLTQVSGLSAFHLSRSFRRAFGLPPHRYQLQRRIDRAKSLLLSGVPSSEIAGAVGFSQQSHFGEQFRRLVGVPPGQYGGAKSRNLIDPHAGVMDP